MQSPKLLPDFGSVGDGFHQLRNVNNLRVGDLVAIVHVEDYQSAVYFVRDEAALKRLKEKLPSMKVIETKVV